MLTIKRALQAYKGDLQYAKDSGMDAWRSWTSGTPEFLEGQEDEAQAYIDEIQVLIDDLPE